MDTSLSCWLLCPQSKARRWANGVVRKWGRTDLAKFCFFNPVGVRLESLKAHDFTGFRPDFNRTLTGFHKNCLTPSSPTPFTRCRKATAPRFELYATCTEFFNQGATKGGRQTNGLVSSFVTFWSLFLTFLFFFSPFFAKLLFPDSICGRVIQAN